jgi:glycosyltransferase involved in cell wall biosynthesis
MKAILIDARVNGMPRAYGLARSALRLAEHLGGVPEDLAVRALVNPGREQLFPLSKLSARAELVSTDITFGAIHRSLDLARVIRAADAAVLYVPYPMFRPLLCPCPVVVTAHDAIVESDQRFAGGWHRQLGLKIVTRAALRHASAVTTPTTASSFQIRQFYPAARSLTVIPNGVDVAPFTAVSEATVAEARRRYDLPARFVLAVGSHRPHKNYEVLVRAMAGMAGMAGLPGDVSLVIAGCFDPAFRSPVPGLINSLGLRARVRLVPLIDDEWLPAVYRAASAFALPSLAEGFGLPALEAMAAGVPVVASAIPVLEEVCGGAATLVPANDPAAWATALTTVLRGGPAVASLVSAGTSVAAAATWERGGLALGELLTSVARQATGQVSSQPARAR